MLLCKGIFQRENFCSIIMQSELKFLRCLLRGLLGSEVELVRRIWAYWVESIMRVFAFIIESKGRRFFLLYWIGRSDEWTNSQVNYKWAVTQLTTSYSIKQLSRNSADYSAILPFKCRERETLSLFHIITFYYDFFSCTQQHKNEKIVDTRNSFFSVFEVNGMAWERMKGKNGKYIEPI